MASRSQASYPSLNAQFDIREVGVVQSVRKFIVNAKGMPSCINGQIVQFASGILGIVMGFSQEKVQILVMGDAAGIRAGDEIYNKGNFLEIKECFSGKNIFSKINSI